MKTELIELIEKQKKILGPNIFKKKVLKNYYPKIIEDLDNFLIKNQEITELPFQQQFYCFLYDIKYKPKCICCNNTPRFKSIVKGYGVYCSHKCSIKNTNIISNSYNKYGKHHMYCDDVKEKIKKTNLEKYGVENVFQNKEIKEKIKKVNLEKYGVENPAKSEKIKKLTSDNNIKKYGVNSPSKLKEIKEKIKKINLEKWGNEFFTRSSKYQKNRLNNELIELTKNKKQNLNFISNDNDEYKILCLDCNDTFGIGKQLYRVRNQYDIKICLNCNPIDNKSSDSENKIYEFVKTITDSEVLCKNRSILNGKEIDILIKEKFIGIEYDGLYWHSEKYKHKNYHLNKTEIAEKNGYKIIHVFEDEWLYKKDIVKSILKNSINKENKNIYARKCEVKNVDGKTYKDFLEKNHIQGYVKSKIKLGLYYKEELVSVMSFGNLRKSLGSKSIENHWEMLRFCNKLNTNVVGGASKLFKYFIKNYNPTKIISFADRRYFTGEMYYKLGFIKEGYTKPNYWYVINGLRKHRFTFRKDLLVKEGFDPNKTEWEIMQERGFDRIWDCGNIKFVYEK